MNLKIEHYLQTDDVNFTRVLYHYLVSLANVIVNLNWI